MRDKAKLIIFAALSAALTVAGLSVAAGGDSSGSGGDRNGNGSERGLRMKLHHEGGPPGMAFDRDVADVMRQIHEAIEKKAPSIAGPVIQKAEDAGDITDAQADKLRAAAQAIADGKRPDLDRALLRDADVRKVIRDAFDASREQAPDIGEPIVQKALDDKKITSDQADEIRERLKELPLPPLALGFGPGFSPRGAPCGPPGPGRIDADVADVLDSIHAAAEKRNPSSTKEMLAIAEPIIDRAVADKKITESQASDIRDHLKRGPRLRFHGGPPPFGAPGERGWDRKGSRQGNEPGVFPGGAAPAIEPAIVPGQPA